ncbi:MmcQ/YjbR family DNA-binding protein [Oscillospiraceae bacterium MB08-C2-2]|nr:MmcQ/YjbR family DNA-binding protein [Oscillospiraceae bacterium MB08-C2-2]
MKNSWISSQCLSLPGAVEDYKEEWDAWRYLIGDKMFAMVGTDNLKRPILTLKLEPEEGRLLREQYEDIGPGYYMNKLHWNSFLLEGSVPVEIMKACLSQAYQLVLAGLPKKVQAAIAGK